MIPEKILKINITNKSAVKLTGLISSVVLLASNSYLTISRLQEERRNRRHQRLSGGFEVAAEVAGALAGLTKVVSEVLEQHRAATG